jgi:predicted transcriptional regulator
LEVNEYVWGGELILKGYDNETIADIVEVTPSAVQKWRKKLKKALMIFAVSFVKKDQEVSENLQRNRSNNSRR